MPIETFNYDVLSSEHVTKAKAADAATQESLRLDPLRPRRECGIARIGRAPSPGATWLGTPMKAVKEHMHSEEDCSVGDGEAGWCEQERYGHLVNVLQSRSSAVVSAPHSPKGSGGRLEPRKR